MACETNKALATQAACQSGIPAVTSSNGFITGRNNEPIGNPVVVITSRNTRPAFVPFGSTQAPIGNSYLPAEGVTQIELTPSRVGVRVGERHGKPIVAIVQNGQIVMRRRDSMPTGLALVPGLILPDRPGDPLREDLRQWWVAHINSGKILSHQGYGDVKEAWRLAGLLAQMDWDREESDFSPHEMARANTTIALFDRVLEEVQQETRPNGPSFMPPPNSISMFRAEPLPVNQSLANQILAHNDHGIVRVLEDRGDVFFVVDTSGDRHELYREELQLPREDDYEAAKVAMEVDPATLNGATSTCAHCGATTDQAQAGTKWYKMGGQPFCNRCANRYAADEGYTRPEAVGVDY